MNVFILLACNDPNCGVFADQLYGVQIYHENEIALDLEGPLLDEKGTPALVINGRLALKGSIEGSFPIRSHGTWVGNWCWDSVEMSTQTAAAFLNVLRASGLFHETGGWCDVSDVWDAAVPITAEALEKALT